MSSKEVIMTDLSDLGSSAFWRVNLRAHLLLWSFLAAFILLTFLLRR